MVLDEKSTGHQSHSASSSGEHECLCQISQQSNSWWDISVWPKVVNRLTYSHCHTYIHTASMAKKNHHLCVKSWLHWKYILPKCVKVITLFIHFFEFLFAVLLNVDVPFNLVCNSFSEITCDRRAFQNADLSSIKQKYRYNDRVMYTCKDGYLGLLSQPVRNETWLLLLFFSCVCFFYPSTVSFFHMHAQLFLTWLAKSIRLMNSKLFP